MILKRVNSLNRNLLSKFYGAKFPVTFKLLRDEDIGAIKTTGYFKELFGPAYLTEQKLLIYEMSLAGVYKLFYPHKFYFAYQKDPFGNLAGCWGGAGMDEEYYRFEAVSSH